MRGGRGSVKEGFMFWSVCPPGPSASSPQRLVELDGAWETEARCRRRSLRFPQGGGGRAREVG